ncbi:ferritin-like domain-containing protein [Marinobacterium arenosum]|uniref:ferritin-like domain-containing protein n=1 Tax=Marinobacterium arenosum TaxID=2862496 RepID=UPI001C9451A9|nr:ferritin-like protein [Marinobacterium arenosum]MBY4676167.1 ferritin-like protein [Marinobacterium arenosum]
MTTQPYPSQCLCDVFSKQYTPISTLEELRTYLQSAVTLEFATIPAYLTALYSMKEVDGDAYRLTRSVALEEMFHVYQAANLLIAVGGIPRFTGEDTPTYPTFIPNGDKEATPYIGLRAATPEVYRDVFMRIETPAPAEAPPEDENIRTIGQFYKAIELGLEYLEAQMPAGETIFHNAPGYTQTTDFYIGKGGGYIVKVTDLASAKLAIRQIVEQGEGAVKPGEPLVPTEAWGAYNHYGNRIDGNYGPILGSEPYELSHYFKFKRIADGSAPLPATYPIVALPKRDNYQGDAAELCDLFNGFYSVFLRAMEQAFSDDPAKQKLYFQTALPIMHAVLPTLAQQMMQTCVWEQGSASAGPNAAPTWQYRDEPLLAVQAETQALVARLQLAERQARTVTETATLQTMLGVLESVKEQADQMVAVANVTGCSL